MSEPRIPGANGSDLELPCGHSVDPDALDLGMRAYRCDCGDHHAVVMDVHPLSRWIPESVEAVFTETIETADDHQAFSTIHLMGLVLEEYPESVVAADMTEHDALGCAMLWITTFDARRLHIIIIELLVELMEHAMSHAADTETQATFEADLFAFDVDAFVDAYRTERDFHGPSDQPV